MRRFGCAIRPLSAKDNDRRYLAGRSGDRRRPGIGASLPFPEREAARTAHTQSVVDEHPERVLSTVISEDPEDGRARTATGRLNLRVLVRHSG